ncbi:glycosyltransferase family 9 protein [Paramaledivibacter caminithermalis]|jgi:hypothetical protein|uniref:Uncharacterized protein n=1 Tax=Paramaledivibacter caminithermalis (strain DSM 15212 / CIP 107654 / DViRD3) TaxID=1121301 RepID=A0A1M6L6N8_PARC5|nr:hypothetical protein [Paramaledivibacter caminithermalis]SHJ66837.1 hypothetical protein SAMN02745912_00685 [Paramaledivibacter caminithermalis DSM 15212]
MKKLLIIRSISFQQLDMNIIEIKNKFPNHEIYLLTHEHGVSLAEKYKDIDRIIVYDYKESFKYRNKVESIRHEVFDAVIVPVNNISGLGFYNVLLYSLSIKAKKRYLCNLISDIKEISAFSILSLGLKNLIYSFFSFVLTLISTLFLILFLPLKLIQIERQ